MLFVHVDDMNIKMSGERTWREKTKGVRQDDDRCPKLVDVRKVPSNGVEDDVQPKKKKRIDVVLTERQCHTWDDLLN